LKTKGTSTLRSIKRIIAILMIAISLILISFIHLHRESGQKEYEDKLIINIFGKQRMYTQMISKDASLLYALMQSLEIEQSYQLDNEIVKKISDTKEALRTAKDDFSETLALIDIGNRKEASNALQKLIDKDSPYLAIIKSEWPKFEQAIDTLVNSDTINENVVNAVIFINDNNMNLLGVCDKLLDQILQSSVSSYKHIEYNFYVLVGLLSIIIIIVLFHLTRFILLPFEQLYKGIGDIGLLHNRGKKSLPTRKKVTPIVSEISDMFMKINNLISLIENINNSASFMETLNFINRTFSSFVPYNYIGIALIDEEKELLRASYGVSDGTIVGLPEKIIGTCWPISDTSMGELIKNGNARIINDLEAYTAEKPFKLYNSVIMEAGIKASITLPLKVSGEPVGVIFFSSSRKNVYTEDHLKFLSTLVNSIAISLNQNIFISDVVYSSVLALAKLAETRDEDTGEHLDRMKEYSREIAELLYENKRYSDEINPEFIEQIYRFSPLHDIGKVGIRDGILLKPGKLSKDEFNEMKRHTVFGAMVLRTADDNIKKRGKSIFGIGVEIAEGHHEKWDGSGYPYGKQGLDIPLSARIVAIADVFDALNSKRPYKEAFSLEKSLEIIIEGRGKHFDPVIVDVFLSNFDRIRKIHDKFRQIHGTVESA
jgi:HD-GYP domain-containing protein (c-di-GMP phosphodiesterase class II)